MQELVIFGACEKYSGHSDAHFLMFLRVIKVAICEKRRQLVLFSDGESNVKWCPAIKVLNNWNLEGNTWFQCTKSHVSLTGCFKKSKHDFLIIESNSRRALFRSEAIFNKNVQSGLAVRENILGQLQPLVVVHILKFDIQIVQCFRQDQPVQNGESCLSLEEGVEIVIIFVVVHSVDGTS